MRLGVTDKRSAQSEQAFDIKQHLEGKDSSIQSIGAILRREGGSTAVLRSPLSNR